MSHTHVVVTRVREGQGIHREQALLEYHELNTQITGMVLAPGEADERRYMLRFPHTVMHRRVDVLYQGRFRDGRLKFPLALRFVN